MYNLAEPFLAAIVADANIQIGKFAKSQFVVERLKTLDDASGVSGV